MSPPENQRASQVCSTCKARKKGCDKNLPNCGYCTERGLDCRFDQPLPSHGIDAAVHDSASWHWWVPQIATSRVTTSSASELNAAFPPLGTSVYDVLNIGRGIALSDVIYSEVSRFIGVTSLSLQDISDRFFDGFHHWLPVISPQRYFKLIADIHDRAPKADFSVLLLAICLIIVRPQSSTKQRSVDFLKTFYMTVRSSFAQVQAIICASTHLIQAGILIAAYEYASRRPDTAYVSIGTCARMSGIIGINEVEAQQGKEQLEADSTSKVLEERNVWWGVIVMERKPMTDFSGDDHDLPVDFRHDQRCDSHTCIAPQSSGSEASPIHHINVHGFGRQAQAIVMLDETLRILKIPDTENARLPALMRLDGQLQVFLALIMSEYRTPGRHCGANATVIRTLLILHQGILGLPTKATSEMTDVQHTTNSLAAIDAAARMMADVAGHHVEHIANIDILPLCAAYNAQIAMKHIVARRDYMGEYSCAALESLELLDKAFRQRWPEYRSL